MCSLLSPLYICLARTLLEAGADPRVVNKDGWTPLHLAVRTGDRDMVDHLLEAGPDTLEVVSNNGRSVLHTACLAGHEALVTRLLEASSLSVNIQDSCGNTPVMDAARARHLPCVRLLASWPRTDLGIEDRMGRTVVEVAAQAGATEVLQLLSELGLDVTAGLSLHAAAREGQAEAARLLVSWGAEVDREDAMGRTPLFLSVSGQHTEAARSLLEAGARLDRKDKEGNTIEDLARKPDVLDMIREFSSK